MRLEWRDGLEFLYSDSEVGSRPRKTMKLDGARGGVIAAHVLIQDAPVGETIGLEVEREGGGPVSGQWFRLVHVPVEKNTGPVGFVEREGERNPHAARRAPFRVFDAMEPLTDEVKVQEPLTALRLQMPLRGKPEERHFSIRLRVGRQVHSLALSVRVHPVTLPPVGARSFPYTNWFSLPLMAARHGLQPWSAAHWRMIERYAERMAHGRQNTFWIPLSMIFHVENGAPLLDRKRLRRLVQLFTAAGLHYIEGGHVATRAGGEWDATHFDITLADGVPATSQEGNEWLAALARPLVAEIDRQGWRDRWIQHVTDEPTSTNAVDYRILCGMVRRHMPGLPLLDATEDPSMAGSVDIWCPQAHQYQMHREVFEQARACGDRVWFYTCCFPGGPWLNRLLDEELLRPCLLGWAASLFGLEGFLHWGLNHYKDFQDPFQQSVVDHGGTNQLPPGDTHIVYPGPDGPWSSLRLEAQREGLEDLELLRMLERKDPARRQRIVGRVIQGFDRYTTEVATLRRARRDLLRALDQS